jgi:WD repeat-containing protein 42A
VFFCATFPKQKKMITLTHSHQNIIDALHWRHLHINHNRNFVNHICGNVDLVARLEPTVWSDPHHPHTGCVNTVQWNSDGSKLVSGGDDVQLNIWNVEKRKVIHTIPTSHTGNIFCAKFLPQTSDTKLVSCAADGMVNVFDIDYSGNRIQHNNIRQFNCHNGMTHKMAFEPNNPNIFITCSQDGTCRLFDLRLPSSSCSFVLVDWRDLPGKERPLDIHSIDINPMNHNYLIAGGGDHYIRLYDRRIVNRSSSDRTDLACIKEFSPEKIIEKQNNANREERHTLFSVHITGVRYNYNGSEFIGTFSGDSIYLFEQDEPGELSNTGAELVTKPKNEFSGHRNIRTVKEVNFLGAKHQYILSGSDDGNIFIWDKESARIVHCIRGDRHIVNCLDLHPKYPLVFASSGIEYDIKVWEPTASEPRSEAMENINEIIQKNRTATERGHSSFVLPATFVLRLLNLTSDSQDEEDGESEQEGEADVGRRTLARLLSQTTFFATDPDDEDENDEQEDTQCRTQ